MGLNNGLKCPRCGSTDIFMVGGLGLDVQAENGAPNADRLYYMCNNCKHIFQKVNLDGKIGEIEELLRNEIS